MSPGNKRPCLWYDHLVHPASHAAQPVKQALYGQAVLTYHTDSSQGSIALAHSANVLQVNPCAKPKITLAQEELGNGCQALLSTKPLACTPISISATPVVF
jgi:hypothetical protein